MNRTTIYLKKCGAFVQMHRRLLLLLGLLLFGFVLGCILYSHYGQGESAFFSTLFQVQEREAGLRGALKGLYNSCFQSVVLLFILFVSGVSACGLPLILGVPAFFGLGFGTCAAYYYSIGWRGVWQVFLLLPSMIIKAIAILSAAAEGYRMTVKLSGVLVTGRTVVGSLQREFKLYILRFFIFLLLSVGGGIVEILLR